MKKKEFFILSLFCVVTISHAEILQIDFSGTYDHWIGTIIYPEYLGGNVAGTIIYNTDLLSEEEFIQEDIFWKWQYQTDQDVFLNVSLNDYDNQPISYNNVSDCPFGNLTTYTEFGYLTGPTVIDWFIADRFELIYQNSMEHSGIVTTLGVTFGFGYGFIPEELEEPIEPFAPQIIFDPEHYKRPYGEPRYGVFRLTTTVYNDSGESEGYCTHNFFIDSCSVAVIPEPSTVLLVCIGGLALRKYKL